MRRLYPLIFVTVTALGLWASKSKVWYANLATYIDDQQVPSTEAYPQAFEGSRRVFAQSAGKKARGLLCNLVKDDPDFIIQPWLEHHLSMGFDILLYDHHSSLPPPVNTSTSWPRRVDVKTFPPQELIELETWQGLPDQWQLCLHWHVGNRADPRPHGFAKCQLAAYDDCLAHARNHDYPWVGNWDVDEYVFPNNRNGSDHGMFFDLLQGFDGDTIEFYCLRFGTRVVGESTESTESTQAGSVNSSQLQNMTEIGIHGDPLDHEWRVPWTFLGETDAKYVLLLQQQFCDSGHVKSLSRTTSTLSMGVHYHDVRGKTIPWNLTAGKQHKGFRCNHYSYRSIDFIKVKAAKNHNSELLDMFQRGLFNESKCFNAVHDDLYASRYLPKHLYVERRSRQMSA